MSKILFILRGVSGSGKSTKARELGGADGVVLSADDFFGVDYNFDARLLGEAHRWNQGRVRDSIKAGKSPIVVDNTNTRFWEMKPYVELGLSAGYEVKFAEPDSPQWKKFHKGMSDIELNGLAVEFVFLNKHGVPLSMVKDMLARWEHDVSLADVLNS
jgi:predicted kinase